LEQGDKRITINASGQTRFILWLNFTGEINLNISGNMMQSG
jgi:hypothetical protein